MRAIGTDARTRARPTRDANAGALPRDYFGGYLADALKQTYFLRGPHRCFERVDFAEVCYLSADGPYTQLHLRGERTFCADGGLCSVLEALDRDDVLQVHKSFAVVVHAIQRFERESMWLRDGTALPVGRTYRERLFAALT